MTSMPRDSRTTRDDDARDDDARLARYCRSIFCTPQ